MALAGGDNSKLVDVVTIADDDRVGNNLLQIWMPRFGQQAKLLFDVVTIADFSDGGSSWRQFVADLEA